MYTVLVDMLAMSTGEREYFKWSIDDDASLKTFFDDCANGDLGLISFAVADGTERIQFVLKPTNKTINKYGSLQPTYYVIKLA